MVAIGKEVCMGRGEGGSYREGGVTQSFSQHSTAHGVQGPGSKVGRHPEAPDEGVLQGEVCEASPVGGE